MGLVPQGVFGTARASRAKWDEPSGGAASALALPYPQHLNKEGRLLLPTASIS